MNISNPLLVFEQFGFILEKQNEKDATGTCPFCHETGHFGIAYNSPNKDWHCFKCGKGGGFQKFLQTIVIESQEYKPQIEDLSKMRGISVETLEAMKVGFLNNVWVVPAFADDGETILNIKIYDGDSFKNTAGCSSAMYGLWALPPAYETVYLAEGEWDALTMMELMNDERAAVLGVPGAGTNLKLEILNLFVGKSVYILYDNDDAGKMGVAKVLATLTPIASEIHVLSWPETAGKGWDVRDVYTKDFKGSADKAFEWILQHCTIPEAIVKNVQTPDIGGEHVSHTLVYETFGKYFKLSDSPKYNQKSTDIYDIIFGVTFANRIPGAPVWLYLVAPPGGFKTEPLLALAGGKLIEMHESVTPAALISGQVGGVDPSLIPQFNGRLVIIKEWDRVLGMPEFDRKEILSILRGAFDGVCGRTFGNGVRRVIKSTFGIIAATTPINEQYAEETASVGERFISWRNWISEDFDVRYHHIKKAMDNISLEEEIRKECGGVCKRVLLSGYKTLPTCSDEFKDQIIHMSQWIGVMRGTVSRDKYRKNVLYKPFSEVATRLSKEILKLMYGISIFKGQVSVRPDSMRIAKSVAWSSISSRYSETFKAFLEKPIMSAHEAEKAVGLPEDTMKIVMENMMMLGILNKVEGMKWIIDVKFLNLTRKAGLC
jgi:CHC2 zinc finger/Toprim-like